MAYNSNLNTLNEIVRSWATVSIKDPIPDNIVLTSGDAEMIKITDEGFWVRGVQVMQDDKEAETVYNAFKQFLMWRELHKS
jgi:K+-sensing histidine kinase KdpD